MVNEVTNSYRFGVDYRGLPKTTISYDELLTYTAINNSVTDNDFGFQLTNGTPVDLGIVSVGTSPCTAASTTPPVASSTCNAYTAYSQVQNPRSSFPVERFSFESSYLKNFVDQRLGELQREQEHRLRLRRKHCRLVEPDARGREAPRAVQRWADRVSTSANWSGDYSVTSKLGLGRQFFYDDFSIPSLWATAETNIFDEPPTALGHVAIVFLSDCNPANFATLCPTLLHRAQLPAAQRRVPAPM